MKKILICSHYFYPDITPRAFRAVELANEFVKRGFYVDVLISDKNILLKDYDPKLNNKIKNTTLEKKIKNPSIIKKIISKTIIYFFGETDVIKKRKIMDKIDNISDYDVIVSIGPPFYIHKLVAKKIRKQKYKGRSITDWGDPFYNSYDSNKMSKHMFYVQKRTLNTFDYLTIPIDNAVSYYANYLSKDRIKVIPQGFNFDIISESNNVDNNVPKFIYAGAFYKKVRDPERILFELSKIEKDFIFEIYTDLNGEIYENVLLKYKKIMGEKLVIKNKLPREEILKIYKKSDFLINMENESSNQTPSKLIDLAMSKRPILSLSTTNPDIGKINKFLEKDYTDKISIDIEQYNIKNVAQKFIDLME